MATTFKVFFFVITADRTWGRGLKLKEAMKNASVRPTTNYAIYMGIVKPEATPEQLDNIMKCFVVTDFGGLELYRDNRTAEDEKMVTDFLAGWVTDDSFVEPKKNKKKG